PAEREARARQVAGYLDGALGPHHPQTLAAGVLAATLTRNPAAAAALYQTACDGYRDWHPKLTHPLVDCAFERAWLADEGGDLATARAGVKLVAADSLAPYERAKAAIAASYLAITDEPSTGAAGGIASMEEIAAEGGKAAEWWNRGEASRAYITAAIG